MADQVVPDSDEREEDGRYPRHWRAQSRVVETYEVAEGEPERAQLEQLFKQTMPETTSVVTLTRIQNTCLWDKYREQKKRLHAKNAGVINELNLFHGTRANDPKLIYGGEDGFDMRLGHRGSWGRANYFSVSASHCNRFAHISEDNCREIFVVKVLTGESCYLPPDMSLRVPPVKHTDQSTGMQIKFDSVTGITRTRGSRVYMTYDNEKAYPAYLIKYFM